jgi:histidyl-tRNA synthetase
MAPRSSAEIACQGPPPGDGSAALALPRGFEERCTQFLEFEARALGSFYRNVKLLNAEVVRVPAVGKSSTFNRGANLTGDKYFPLVDRKGRDLMLTPDGMSLLMRWYLSESRGNEGTDLGWLSPIFRYRKDGNRQFTQFGYASFNSSEETSPFEPASKFEEITGTLLRTIAGDLNIPMKLVITNPGAWKEWLRVFCGIEGERARNLLNSLRPLDWTARRNFIKAQLSNDNLLSIVDAVGSLSISSRDTSLVESSPPLSNAIIPLLEFGSRVTSRYGMDWEIDLGDLHSSEILDGPCVRFISPSGRSLGDGGTYHSYGQRFDPSIKRYFSVCAGFEGLAAAAGVSNRALRLDTFFVLLAFPESLSFCRQLTEQLRDKGVPTTLVPLTGSLKKMLTRYSFSKFVAVVGPNEVSGAPVTLKNLVESTTESVSLQSLPSVLQAKNAQQ